MNDEKLLSSNLKTIAHRHQVAILIYSMIQELEQRSQVHDDSKLESPEQEIFAEHSEELAKTAYGSPEYQALLEKIKPAIEHHYANNRHHPEHWPNGVEDMTLIDLVELLCDWKASSARNKNGNIRKSIETNAKRFAISPQLQRILENTVREMFQE